MGIYHLSMLFMRRYSSSYYCAHCYGNDAILPLPATQGAAPSAGSAAPAGPLPVGRLPRPAGACAAPAYDVVLGYIMLMIVMIPYYVILHAIILYYYIVYVILYYYILGAGWTGTSTNGYPVFLSPAVRARRPIPEARKLSHADCPQHGT